MHSRLNTQHFFNIKSWVGTWNRVDFSCLGLQWKSWQAGSHLCPWLVSGQITQAEHPFSSPTLYLSISLTLSISLWLCPCIYPICPYFIKEMREASASQKKRAYSGCRAKIALILCMCVENVMDKLKHQQQTEYNIHHTCLIVHLSISRNKYVILNDLSPVGVKS